ncbi:MAG: heme ABC exporter ATP-binding protein CcmA [Actinomycetota bacterium]|nr:heme ABC exporter ATP-binding protein CcmA [Actinomycetota bacterium]
MSDGAVLVDLEGVSVRAGAVRILDDVSLTVRAGEAVGIFGSNGAGKTTLLRLIATLQPPQGGRCSVFGADMYSVARYDVRHRIGYVGHTPGLYPELTLLENLAFVADAQGLPTSEALRSLELVGLGGAADRRADHSSHGMQRRTEFARILMTGPELLLLDEPHSALDADAINLVDTLVHRTVDRGGAAVLVSHDRDRMNTLTTRTHEIKNGTLL